LSCLSLFGCVLPSWPPPWASDDDDVTADDDAADDDSGDDDDIGSPPDLDWVTIDGGEFNMGSETGAADELPIHAVTVPTFEILATEVTVAQYAACFGDGTCTEPDGEHDNCTGSPAPGDEDLPVGCVSWDQAVTFCEWADGRLPSEAEWEYAARNQGKVMEYPWGDAQATCTYAIMHDDEYGSGCGLGMVWEVCSRSPVGDTASGLCDMAGNAAEWVQDWYHTTYDGAPDDGSAWEDGGGGGRITRGGSTSNDWERLRTTVRGYSVPDWQVGGLGFRCVRSP